MNRHQFRQRQGLSTRFSRAQGISNYPGWDASLGVRFVLCLLVAVLQTISIASLAQEFAGDDVESDYARGVSAFAEGQYEKAAAFWLSEASGGSAEAQFNIGVLYSEGKGLPTNRQEAMIWFLRASQQGHVEAQYNLGHLLLAKENDADRVSEGIQWWRRSAEGGFVPAQYNYARALYYGIGVEQNRRAAKAWFEHAAIGGNTHAAQFIAKHQDEFGPVQAAAGSLTPEAEESGKSRPARVEEESMAIGENTDYVRVGDETTHAHTRFNSLSPIITRLEPGTLLRVMQIKGGWLKAEVQGGLPGWVPLAEATMKGDTLEMPVETEVIADPTEPESHNDFATLEAGIRVRMLAIDDQWVRVRLPTSVTAWVEASRVQPVSQSTEEIAAQWSAQEDSEAAMAGAEASEALPGDAADTGIAATTSVDASVGSVAQQLSQGSPAAVLASSDPTAGMSDFERNVAQSVASDTPMSETRARDETDSMATATQLFDFASSPDQDLLAEGVAEDSARTGLPVMAPEANDDPGLLAEPGKTDSVVVASGSIGRADPGRSAKLRSSSKRLEVLTAPMSGSPRITTLDQDALVEIVTIQEGFARVTVPGGLPLWVAENTVRLEGDEAVVSGRRVRGWSGAGGEGRAMGLLPDGSILRVLTKQEDWVRVMAPEWLTAWVAASSLDIPDDSSDLDRIWRQQADARLESYLDEMANDVPPAGQVSAAGSTEPPVTIEESGAGFRAGGNRR